MTAWLAEVRYATLIAGLSILLLILLATVAPWTLPGLTVVGAVAVCHMVVWAVRWRRMP